MNERMNDFSRRIIDIWKDIWKDWILNLFFRIHIRTKGFLNFIKLYCLDKFWINVGRHSPDMNFYSLIWIHTSAPLYYISTVLECSHVPFYCNSSFTFVLNDEGANFGINQHQY